jgi:hypothetical protein
MVRILLLLVLLLPSFTRAQLEEEMSSNGYFVKMNKTLNLRLDLDNDVRTFELESSEFEGIEKNYSIEPNTRLRMAVAFNYRFFSLKVGFSPQFLAGKDEDLKGKTKIFRLSLNLFLKDWMQHFDFNQVKGYYIRGLDAPISGLAQEGPPYIILPDLKSLSITGTTYYRFNEAYSFKAVINQNEIQTKSAGSFVPSLYYGYFEISNKETLQDTKSLFAVLNAGYYHTFVLHKNWYSNLGLSPGLGIEFNKLITRIDDNQTYISRQNSLLVNINTQIGIGYNSRRFYGGTALLGSATHREDTSILQFDNVRGYFKIFVGYRFNAPASFEKGMDWIEDKNPFKKK